MKSTPLENALIAQIFEQNPSLPFIDQHCARFFLPLVPQPSVELFLSLLLVSHRIHDGDVCVDLRHYAGKPYQVFLKGVEGFFPEYPLWVSLLKSVPLIGPPESFHPFILREPYLYFYRYWNAEKQLAQQLLSRLEAPIPLSNPQALRQSLEKYFPTSEGEEGVDWQKVATAGAFLQKFFMISGGPGTGKTTTVLKLLALLLEHISPAPLIQMAAPTGKAAARLQEAIQSNKKNLPCDEAIKASIPEEVSTIHRLLGYSPASHFFSHHSGNPLPADIVVVDEASMVDLTLMTHLVKALRSSARFILLGDQNQLTSVEAGWVFGNLCEEAQSTGYSAGFLELLDPLISWKNFPLPEVWGSPLADHFVQLRKSYRFQETSGIMALSQSIIEGNAEQTLNLFRQGNYKDIVWMELKGDLEDQRKNRQQYLRECILEGYGGYLNFSEESYRDIFQAFSRFRILCALVKGDRGVQGMNLFVEKVLKQEGVIHPENLWYWGRPIMITKNDYSLQLFNGDIGITLRDPLQKGLKVYFQEASGQIRSFLPQRLPEHETAFATTVHKSQGSEFDQVVLVLPEHFSSILTQELAYTAVTRAKRLVKILGEESILLRLMEFRENRVSGLKEYLKRGG
jgi:exodeoxyribonuclease V alpha subunit